MAALWVLALAAAVAATPFLAQRLRGLSYAPRHAWLSFAGGVPLAFVFLELLPALAEGAEEATERGLAHDLPYLVALAGFALFYGMERAARKVPDTPEGRERATFAVMTIVYALLNTVAAYLLVAEERAWPGLLLFALALALKLFVADRALFERHQQAYDRVGRWVLLASFLAGAALGHITELPEIGMRSLQAALAGAIILVVVKEELPSEREARWRAFLAGVATFAALFLAARAWSGG